MLPNIAGHCATSLNGLGDDFESLNGYHPQNESCAFNGIRHEMIPNP